MVVILNNDTQHPIPISSCEYDYIDLICHLNNDNTSEWSNDLVNYLMTLKNVSITSIALKDGNTTLRAYNNTTGSILNIHEFFNVTDEGKTTANLYIDISLPTIINNN